MESDAWANPSSSALGGPEPRTGNLAPRACGCAWMDSASSELSVRGREAAGSAGLAGLGARPVRRPWLHRRLRCDSGAAATSCGRSPAPGAVGGPGRQRLLGDWLGGAPPKRPNSNCRSRLSRGPGAKCHASPSLSETGEQPHLFWSVNEPHSRPLPESG